MLVNSVFRGFFNNRLVVGSGIAPVMVAIFFIASSFTKHPDGDLQAKQANLMIRQIGDRLLLLAGDSTSRVLPVTEVKEGTFLLEFENEFVFSHDSLMALSKRLLPKAQFPSGYTVTVHECMTSSIVYGFQVNNTSPDILACRGRRQPRGCYTIEIVLPDLYRSAELKKAEIDQLAEGRNSFKVDPRGSKPKREELKSLEVDPQESDSKLKEPGSFKVDPGTAKPKPEELTSVDVDPQQLNRKPEEFRTTTFDNSLINLGVSGMLVLLGVTLLIGRFGKTLIRVPGQAQGHSILKGSVPESAALGKFLFDVKDQRLLLGSEVISLTDKECKILELLNEDFGELIPRETLMQKVWIDEGVITGRSLDMFVSKLRKKLSSDAELRITNVHGKGYKLEMAGI